MQGAESHPPRLVAGRPSRHFKGMAECLQNAMPQFPCRQALYGPVGGLFKARSDTMASDRGLKI